MSSITLGVAALVAINSFRTNAEHSVQRESRALLGADVRIGSSQPFPKPVSLVLDSARSRYDVARVTTLVSMAVAANSGDTRLVQLRAIEPGYPFYGEIETEPANRWREVQLGGHVIADATLLSNLGLVPGDSLLLGDAAFVISGALKKSPNDFSFAIGPRVYIALKDLPKTGLVRFGSLAQYQAYLRMPNDRAAERFVTQHKSFFRSSQIGSTTAREQSEEIAKALGALSRFLGLVGLAALLLGGLGVATAVHVFVKSKRNVIAMLRCLGAQQRTVFGAYLLQAGGIAFVGALVGVLLGLVVQAVLPRVMSALVPFEVSFGVDWLSVASGLGVGVLVALLFATVPLLGVRGVSPLQALRADYEPTRVRFDPYRIAAFAALITGIAALCVWQADNVKAGLAFALALALALLILTLIAWLLTRITRRMRPVAARFTFRQGIANLHRPRNQTVSVTLSLGFGVFVIATMFIVQKNLLGWLNIENRVNAPNVLAFDIQADQAASVQQVFARHHARAVTLTPMVPARISALNGTPVDSLINRKAGRKVEPWVIRREYRNSYRDTTVATEKLVAGRWFDAKAGAQRPVPISIDQDVAHELNVKLGDRITWDIQGVPLESRITSLRKVDWAQFNTNFYVVFPTGVLENAPHTFVALGRVDSPQERGALQRDMVAANSNVSIIDLANVREYLEDMLRKVMMAIRFMALFSITAGIIVLIGAVATSRFQRLRESALLKTIGASRRQITEILVTEYAALGVLAGATGVLLAGVASWLLVKYLFKLEFQPHLVALAGLWLGVTVLAVVVGLANSREVFNRAPLAVLREISE